MLIVLAPFESPKKSNFFPIEKKLKAKEKEKNETRKGNFKSYDSQLNSNVKEIHLSYQLDISYQENGVNDQTRVRNSS